MNKLLYLEDSYKKSLETTVTSIAKKGDHYEVVVDQTIFYPQGGGQPADKGTITGNSGTLTVTHVRLDNQGVVIHEGKLRGTLDAGETITATLDWELRLDHMRWHSAGHVIHEIIMQLIPGLTPLKGEHGKHPYIEYEGTLNPKLKDTIEKQTNLLIAEDRPITTEFVTYDELVSRVAYVPTRLPKNKPLRIIQIQGFPPTPDGGTQVKQTSEVGPIKITEIEQQGESVRVHYSVPPREQVEEFPDQSNTELNPSKPTSITLDQFRSLILEQQQELFETIAETPPTEINQLKVNFFGSHGKATKLIKELRNLHQEDRKAAGQLVNEFKNSIENAFQNRLLDHSQTSSEWFDTSLPGIKPPLGHLHIVTQAIIEITDIFKTLGFTRVRHPEVDWDYYPFEALNMPANHPARDEWETFFIEYPGKPGKDPRKQKIVLTPHTSNGQVREMEKGNLPIRIINIAKCYRRQSDVSHVPMFHQFEGLYIDKNVSIGHLKGVFDYFVKQFFGSTRKSRLRPFHFQFTEPSFEIDISCGICNGKGCKLCKEGWLELGGSGMVHPVVLRNGGIDPDEYSGFAFGWGVERTYMMKAGTKLDDIRLLYSNDIRFLEQF